VDIRRILGRFAAAVVGLVGVVIGVIINFLVSAGHDLFGLGGDIKTHGWIGLTLMLIAFVGVLLAMFKPRAAALLLAVGGLGLFYPLGLLAILPAVFLVIAALLAYFDRSPAQAKSA